MRIFILFALLTASSSLSAQFDLSGLPQVEDKTYEVLETVPIYGGTVELVLHRGTGAKYIQAGKTRWGISAPEGFKPVAVVQIGDDKCPVFQMTKGGHVAVVRSTKSGMPYLKKVMVD